MSDKDEAIRIDNRGNFAGNINSPHGQVEVGKQQIELTPELEGLLREYMRDPVIAEEIVTAEDDEKSVARSRMRSHPWQGLVGRLQLNLW